MDSDDAAILRASLDDPARFTALFERHHRVIWSYLARLGGREVADDLAGDVFATAFAKRSRFDPSRGAVRSWLYGIASNRFKMRLRTERRRRDAFAKVGAQRDIGGDAFERLDDQMALADEHSLAMAAMQRLGSSDRQLLVLYAWQQLSYEEIAEVLKVPVGTVRSRLSRARQRLSDHRDALVGGGSNIPIPTRGSRQNKETR